MVGGGRGECHRRFKTVVDEGFFLGEGGPITTDLPLLTPKTGGDALAAIVNEQWGGLRWACAGEGVIHRLGGL